MQRNAYQCTTLFSLQKNVSQKKRDLVPSCPGKKVFRVALSKTFLSREFLGETQATVSFSPKQLAFQPTSPPSWTQRVHPRLQKIKKKTSVKKLCTLTQMHAALQKSRHEWMHLSFYPPPPPPPSLCPSVAAVRVKLSCRSGKSRHVSIGSRHGGGV